MTEVLQSPSPFPSPSTSSTACTPPTPNDGSNPTSLIDNPTAEKRVLSNLRSEQEEEQRRKRKERNREADQLSILALLLAALRKSLTGCSNIDCGELSSMEIGWPSNVRHVAHVTFDRFNGFLGLPVEFEPEVPRRAPSASANVFGVSTESMQLSFDSRGNSVPTILLLMQRRLYGQGGLQAEGIFRINAENSQEEYVRDELNGGVVPNGIDVHCLAGLIKAWFRELPTGIMDSLLPEQVMQSQTEEECAQLVRLLPPTEAALLDWAINLMADVAELENLNKMNARNVAMVFAPNMTQHADPLTALRYAVQVMNFLKILIIRTLREREHSVVEVYPMFHIAPPDEDDYQRFCSPFIKETKEECNEGNEVEKQFVNEEPALGSPQYSTEEETTARNGSQNSSSPSENTIPGGSQSLVNNCPCEVVTQVSLLANGLPDSGLTHPATEAQTSKRKSKTSQSNTSNCRKGSKKLSEQLMVDTLRTTEMNKTTRMLGRINSRHELVEAWR